MKSRGKEEQERPEKVREKEEGVGEHRQRQDGQKSGRTSVTSP